MNWTQLRAIVWLRWRLTRNQLARGGEINAIVSIVFVVLMLLGAVGSGLGGLALGLAESKSAPLSLLFMWDAVIFMFVIFWLGGLMVELQRSEIIDIPRLLHLPVTLGQVFAINYLASHFTPVLIVAVPGMLGLSLGLTIGAGPWMALLFLVVIGFMLAVTAWTYCLRGWLASIMMSKRKRRAILVWVTVLFVALAQAPNLFFNSGGFRSRQEHAQEHRARPRDGMSIPPSVVDAHAFVPFGWPGYAAMRLSEDRWAAPLAMAAGGFLIAFMGLARAYRSTICFYPGTE